MNIQEIRCLANMKLDNARVKEKKERDLHTEFYFLVIGGMRHLI